MLKLVISDDAGATTVVPLVRDEISIGREDGNMIRLTERNISRKHARMTRSGDGYVIEDLGSYNGLVVNGKPATGETPLKPGDLVKIGDYVLSVELQDGAQDAAGAAQDADLASGIAIPSGRAAPTRLVMLTDPAPGAEFSVRRDGVTRLGRSEELDVPIAHRSVSREHAEIRGDETGFHVRDLGSVNGILVNGSETRGAKIQPGDTIQLGDVEFRFVGEGEHFQPNVVPVSQPAGRRLPVPPRVLWAGAGVAALGIVLLIFGTWTGSGDEPTVTDLEPRQGSGETVDGQQGAQVSGDSTSDSFATSLRDCRSALQGERFAEAMAYAASALKLRPSDKAAAQCGRKARSGHEQEQIFVRGKSALDNGDLEGAYEEFSKLKTDSPFRQRPEVTGIGAELARSRVDLARAVLASDAERASTLAGSVLTIPEVSSELQASAREIMEQARKAQASQASKDRTTGSAKVASAARKAAPSSRRSTSRQATRDRRTATTASSASARTTRGGSGQQSRLAAASACLARGDNQCAIRALAGKARTADELGLLIETYRAVGDNRRALRSMAQYLERYPRAPRAGLYRRMLQRSNP